MFSIRATVLAVSLSVSCTSAARAVLVLGNGDVASLTTILNSTDRQLRVGDKLFTFGALTANAFSTSTIYIAGFIAANPLDGIGFELTGGFGDTAPGNGEFSHLLLSYSVEVVPDALAAGHRIKDAGLLFNGAAHGQGSYASATESITNLATGTHIVTLTTSVTGNGSGTLQDRRDFSPETFAKLEVTTDLRFLAAGTGDAASASFIRQSFSQVVIPAPATAMLGVFGLSFARRRR